MTLLEILRTAMGMPPPPPDISQPDDEQRVFPLGRGKLTAEEFRYTLALAEGGDVAARLCVGLLYYRGLGVRPNQPQAYKWLSLAAEQGDPKAAEFQQVLLQAMTPDEIANSRCLIARFKGEPEPEFNNEEIHFESPEEISTSTADTEQMVYGFKSWQPRPVGQEHEPFEPSARPPSVTHAATAPRPVVPPKPAAQIPPPAVTVQPAPATKSSRGMLWLLTLVILGGVSMGAWLYFHSPAQEVKRDPVPPIEPVTNAAFSMPKMRLAPPSNAIEQPVDSAERMLFAPKKSKSSRQ